MKGETLTMIRQLRDWQQIAQQRALFLAGTPEATDKLAESARYGAMANYLERQEQQMRVAIDAIRTTIAWDKRTGLRLPYRVRDPLQFALSKCGTPTNEQQDNHAI